MTSQTSYTFSPGKTVSPYAREESPVNSAEGDRWVVSVRVSLMAGVGHTIRKNLSREGLEQISVHGKTP